MPPNSWNLTLVAFEAEASRVVDPERRPIRRDENACRWRWVGPGGDAPDGVVSGVGEPHCAVRADGDSLRNVDARAGVVGNDPSRRDAPDGVPCVREPQGAVRADGDPARIADARSGVVGDDTSRRDAPDGVVSGVGEPQGAVRAGGDPDRNVDARSGVVGNDPPVVMRPMDLLVSLV